VLFFTVLKRSEPVHCHILVDISPRLTLTWDAVSLVPTVLNLLSHLSISILDFTGHFVFDYLSE